MTSAQYGRHLPKRPRPDTGRRSRGLAAVLAVVALCAAASLPAPASAQAVEQCREFPTGTYARAVSHRQVIDYVDGRLAGDWTAYIARQVDRLRQFKALQVLGKPLAVWRDGVQVHLTGAELSGYIATTAQRIEVLRCLARRQGGPAQAAAQLNDFATAAGGSPVSVRPRDAADTASAPQAPQLAQLALRNKIASPPAKPLDIEIVSACQGDTTVFRVVNKGPEFPDFGTIAIYQIGGPERRLVKNRRMLLGSGQGATFKIKKQLNPGGQLGLFIDPTWYVRPSGLDAVMTCG